MIVILWCHKFPSIHLQNPADDEVYSIGNYVIKFVSDLRQVGGFSPSTPVPPPIKLIAPRYFWHIVESDVKHHKPIM